MTEQEIEQDRNCHYDLQRLNKSLVKAPFAYFVGKDDPIHDNQAAFRHRRLIAPDDMLMHGLMEHITAKILGLQKKRQIQPLSDYRSFPTTFVTSFGLVLPFQEIHQYGFKAFA